MWDEDEGVRLTARELVTLIAEHYGGKASMVEVVKQKCLVRVKFSLCLWDLCLRIRYETAFTSPWLKGEGLYLWMTITRLVRKDIFYFGRRDDLKLWLQVPLVCLDFLISFNDCRTCFMTRCFVARLGS